MSVYVAGRLCRLSHLPVPSTPIRWQQHHMRVRRLQPKHRGEWEEEPCVTLGPIVACRSLSLLLPVRYSACMFLSAVLLVLRWSLSIFLSSPPLNPSFFLLIQMSLVALGARLQQVAVAHASGSSYLGDVTTWNVTTGNVTQLSNPTVMGAGCRATLSFCVDECMGTLNLIAHCRHCPFFDIIA